MKYYDSVSEVIEEGIEAVLSDMGITAKTRIFDFKLTEKCGLTLL